MAVVRSLRLALALAALWLLSPTTTATAEEAPAEADRVATGWSAPDFTLASSAGADHTLSQLRGEKNLLMVFFRGTW